jgi:hypothetical protein
MANSGDARTPSRGVFISYRRGETSGQARALHDRLAQRFGAERVFMDVDSIDPGADFVQKIEEAIGSSGVTLVLIGRDWLNRRSEEHLLDDPTDFVRLETDTALRSGMPVIPILVERAPMPEPEELPESLRPLTRRNALELENQRWEYDVSRLVRAVERLIDPEEEQEKVQKKDKDKTGGGGGDEAKGEARGRERRSWLSTRNVVGAVAVVAVAVVLIVLFVLKPPPPRPPAPKPRLLSATRSVAAVHSDRLALTLLQHGIGTTEIPSDVSASSPQLQTYRAPGLVASVNNGLTGPGPDLYILYEVFDNAPDASHYDSISNALASSYRATGTFRISGVGDPTKCESGQAAATSTQQAEWDWSCLTRSSTVVSFIVVTSFSDTPATGVDLAATLTRDAIRHLASAAAATSRLPAPAPPGTRSPQQLQRLLLSGPPDHAVLPFGVGTPTVQKFAVTDAPGGLLDGSFVSNTFHTGDYGDYLAFYVFASRKDAKTWFGTDLRPSGSTVGPSINSSGFSQTARCGTYSKAETSATAVISACYVAWGDVIAISESWRLSTAKTPLLDNENLAVALARTAVSDLISLDAP